ncbi:DUF1223 domain-containing protein [Pedobacter sp. HMF7647]|uniref:DUF1223 domain-containing protein n=1 Tax=Hufsiella arboris TaxID=2695275 RepID=A0A7K1Y7V9_9SPHI|nr:DUF1223 domain-containing protein [Hufsiella arboris]MXV50510.1 DUF1223 domain-containing protein [Hufsiella arboris]
MKTILLFISLILSSFIKSDNKAPGFVVIELFTSEGCSSCPSADRLLKKLEARYEGQQVYVMEFHVDYWDKYGWKDPYSQHAFTERQWAYCDYLKSTTYTPQAVINGKEQFVGSDSVKVINSINYFFNQAAVENNPPEYAVSNSGKQITITCPPDSKLKGDQVHAALVKKGGKNDVTSGENKGRTLEHVNIVQDFKTATLGRKPSQLQVTLPESESKDSFNLIVYTQDPKNLAITSVKQLPIN